MKLQKNPFQVVPKTMWENQELNESESDLSQHHAIECKVMGMQMVNSANVKNAVTGQVEPMVAIVANVLIPIDPRKLNTGLVTPDGMSTAFTKACPIAPTLRVVLNEEYMCPSYIPKEGTTENIETFLGTDQKDQEPKELNIDELLKGLEK